LEENIMNLFMKEALAIQAELIAVRRDLHRHPETGMTETRTARIVAEYLKGLGLEVREGVGGTGVVGLLKNQRGGRTVAIRADMDALPMTDRKTADYRSCIDGRAHACGHDGHTAMLLGAASILCRHAGDLDGNVKFIFQPAEEQPPGGAIPMIQDGILDRPRVNGLFTCHVHPNVPQGSVMVKTGYCTVSSASFSLDMIGKGGHVALPHQAVDPLVMAASCISAAQNIISRRTDPLDPVILAFGSIHGGTANNIIPDSVNLKGTIRGLSPDRRDRVIAMFRDVVEGTARMHGGDYRLDIAIEYPSVYNEQSMVDLFRNAAAKIVGEQEVIHTMKPFMGGEDVSYFQEKVPGVFWFLGTNNPDREFTHPLHSPLFDFDEAVLPVGSALHTQCAVDFLSASSVPHLPDSLDNTAG
jgi:amidohydrolase